MGRHWGEDWGDNCPHRDISEAIILAAIRMQKVLGPSLLENAYIMDLVVDHMVVVEAKAIAKFSDADFAQLNSCLHFASFEVGLLINFHNWPLKDGGIKRLVNTKPSGGLH